MKTIAIPIYNYSELSKEIKHEVLNKFRYINTSNKEWWHRIFYKFTEICSSLTINVNPDDIFFRGFYSQGGKCSFISTIRDINRFIQAIENKEWQKYIPNLEFRFTPCPIDKRVISLIEKGDIYVKVRTYNRHKDYNLNFKTDYEFHNQRKEHYLQIEGEIQQLEKWTKGIFYILNRYLYNMLEEEYEQLLKNESIIKTFEKESYQFTKRGFYINPII